MTLYIEINSSLTSCKSNISIGMCAVDASTGNVFYYESHGSDSINDNEAIEEAQRFYHFYRPIELIIYEISNKDKNYEFSKILDRIDILPNQLLYKYQKINPNLIKITYQNMLLQKVYNKIGLISPIEYFNLSKNYYSVIAIVVSFDYIHQHNENLIKELKEPSFFNDHKYMILANNAQYQLNIIDYYNGDKFYTKFQSLYSVLNNCCTAMGKRLLKNRLCAPFTDFKIISEYYELTEEIIKSEKVDEIRNLLKQISDLDKLLRKLSIKHIQPYELYNIYESFINIGKLIELMYNSDLKKYLYKYLNKNQIKIFYNAINFIEETFIIEKLKLTNLIEIKSSFYNKKIHIEIDKIENQINLGIGFIEKLVDKLEKMDDNLSLQILNNDRDGYYIKTTKLRGKRLEKLLNNNNKIIIDENTTINNNDLKFNYQINTVKITYPGLQNHSEQIDELYKKLDLLIKNTFFTDLNEWYNKYLYTFKIIINFITEIDYVANNCFTSKKYHYVKPNLIEDNNSFINCKQLRHPIIERLINYEYTPHDVLLDDKNKGIMIYGVNSCGKSSLMKAIGLNLIMAQCGLYVASSNFNYSIFDSLYTRISGNDNLFKGQSSFIIELNELSCILKKATTNSLIIGDEICRGTEYLSANALVAASIVRLLNMNAKFIFATHLHDLISIERIKNLENLKFYHLSVDNNNNELIFNRKLEEGTGEQIYGITIAKFILDDPLFIKESIEIKNELLEKKNINTKLINDKKSLYNNDIYMDNCFLCKSQKKLESHHITFQRDFKQEINGLINSKKKHLLKDSSANLIVLCNDCHNSIHKDNIKIESLVKSTDGIKILVN